MDIKPGQLVALVGPSGAGKTTITGLVARFHDPQQGRILIDGTDLRQVTRSSLTRQLGMVFQDTFLFHASIADNLRYARPDAADADLVAAARAAHLHEFITALPKELADVAGDRGAGGRPPPRFGGHRRGPGRLLRRSPGDHPQPRRAGGHSPGKLSSLLPGIRRPLQRSSIDRDGMQELGVRLGDQVEPVPRR